MICPDFSLYLYDMREEIAATLVQWADKYNDPQYFTEDPIAFARYFAKLFSEGKACLQDVEIAGLLAAHLAWGRRSMIVRDSNRLMEQMNWQPYAYVMNGDWRSDATSLHRTIKWSEIAAICRRLRDIYLQLPSVESLEIQEIRCDIFGSAPDRNAANKKINMFRRWMVRDDGIVDLGLWKNTPKTDLLIPLDVHVHNSALELGLTGRKGTDIRTVYEITDAFREIFPDDPCKGDFALFGHGVSKE